MGHLGNEFKQKAEEIKTKEDKLKFLVEEILRDSELELLANYPEEAEWFLNDAFSALEDSDQIWQALMVFIQSDAAYTMAEDISADKHGIGPFLRRQIKRLNTKDKEEFTAFLTLSKAGKKALENPRVGQMLMSDQSQDPMVALLLAMAGR